MRLTREILEAGIMGYLMGTGQKATNENGFVERSNHQRRRGRPPKVKLDPRANVTKMTIPNWKPRREKRKYTKRSSFWKKEKVEA